MGNFAILKIVCWQEESTLLMLRMRLMVGTLVVLLVVLLVRMATMPIPGAVKPFAAPDLDFRSQKVGSLTTLSALQGKVVILDFWATWCGPCRQSIPELARVYSQYKEKGLQVIGISLDEAESRKDIPAAIKELGITYPIVFGTEISDLREKYNFEAIPQFYLIDKRGQVRVHIPGYDPTFQLESEVVKLLGE